MNSLELLRSLKDKIETDAQISESDTAVTDIHGDKEESRFVVLREIEGKLRMLEVSARVLEY